MSWRASRSFNSLALLWILFGASRLANADWPQWRGPNRDDVSSETGLLKKWPEGGPRRIWLFEDCGLGYSGPAIVGNRLYTIGARGGTEILLAIDISHGEEVWATPVGEMLGNNWGDGPRGTPTVAGEFVYALGAKGDLICARVDSGKALWRKSMEELGGDRPNWGFCESPLVVGDKVICTPGGDKGSLAALDAKTGDVKWQSSNLTSAAHYSSAVLREGSAGWECVQLLPDQLVGVDMETGNSLWSTPWPNPTAAIPTPIVRDNFVYATSGYGVGCKLVAIGDDHSVDEVYENKTMKNKHGGVVLVGDHLYGSSEALGWVCQDFKTGKQIWRNEEALEAGSVTYADGMLYCVGEDNGDVVLVEASPDGWKDHGRFRLEPQTDQRKDAGKIWTHPVVCDGKLYLRDQNLLYCYDIAAPGLTASAGGK